MGFFLRVLVVLVVVTVMVVVRMVCDGCNDGSVMVERMVVIGGGFTFYLISLLRLFSNKLLLLGSINHVSKLQFFSTNISIQASKLHTFIQIQTK